MCHAQYLLMVCKQASYADDDIILLSHPVTESDIEQVVTSVMSLNAYGKKMIEESTAGKHTV